MEQRDLARVTELMGRMAGGDSAAMFELQGEFGPSLRWSVRRVLQQRGTELPAGEVDDLVASVALMLMDKARTWRPDGGALPWVWAERKVANIVDAHLGSFCDELDDVRLARVERLALHEGGPVVGPSSEQRPSVVLERLARLDARVALLSEALHRVANARDIELWLAMREQEAMGDRSPAASVGPWLGMEPAAARQQRRRVELRLQALVRDDAHFAALAGVFEPIVAAA